MTLQEIEYYLGCSDKGGVCIEYVMSKSYPGVIFEVWIVDRAMVQICYSSYGHFANGVCIDIEFPSIEAMVLSLEGYLGKALAAWTDLDETESYPDLPYGVDNPAASWNHLCEDIKYGRLHVPLLGNSYTVSPNIITHLNGLLNFPNKPV